MGELFGRRAVLQMNTVEVDGLRISFKVTKLPSAKAGPNTAEISVWNLSADTRAKVTQAKVPLILQAGYGNDISQLFSGDIQRDGITTSRDGVDIVTTFKAGDGVEAYRSARVQEAFAKGASLAEVIEKSAKSMGKNAASAIAKAKEAIAKKGAGALAEFFNGVSLSGKAADVLSGVCESAGLEWSIQDDILQIVSKGGWTDEQAVLLTLDTGLIGSPEVGADGLIKIKSLLQPEIRPKRRVKLETALLNGFAVVTKVEHNGDTHGAEWYTDCEARLIP